jgi:anti-sigma B factor antagonist
MLKVENRPDGDVLVVQVSGELDSSTADEVRAALAAVSEDNVVVVDLRDVPFMDSAGLGALIGGIRRFRARGTPTALCVRRGAVERLLTATGFDRIVPTFASVEDARQALLVANAPPEVAPA